MRQRTTYLLPQGTGTDPTDIRAGHSDLTFAKSHEAVQERRITVGLSDLPEELQTLLEDFHEIHIRIASSKNYQAHSPAVSRVPPGLHVFFTPQEVGQNVGLCSALKRVLGDTVKCGDSADSFSKPHILSERFASSSTYQFFHGPVDLRVISSLIEQELCPGLSVSSTNDQLCKILAGATDAAYVDYDYDVISHAVTITILSPASGSLADSNVRSTAHKPHPDDRLEVGILSPENPDADSPEELKLGGYLIVIGDDEQPSPTLFSFPSRHHPLPHDDRTTYSISFQNPSGLHPKLDITLPTTSLTPPKDSCALHAYLTLPSSLFIDRYQLSDPLFLQSQNLISLRAISGEQDLEAPAWAIEGWGSASLLELAHPPPSSTQLASNWTITIPTHLRYINVTSISSASGHGNVEVPWPVVFWACEAEEGLKMNTNPFDRVNVGYDGLFGPKTMFYHVPPAVERERLVETLAVPVLGRENAEWVSTGTLVAVIMGFGWVAWKLFGSEGRVGSGDKGEKKTL